MQLTHIKDCLAGERVVRFRCKDSEVSDYVADLAANLQKSVIPCLAKNTRNDQPPPYSLTRAVMSVVNAGYVSGDGYYSPVVKFNVPKDFYCSELVVYLYAMAYFHLEKEKQGRVISSRIGRRDLSPSTVYSLLSQCADFVRQDIHIHPQYSIHSQPPPVMDGSPDSKLDVNIKADDAAMEGKTQAFKEKIEQIKSKPPVEMDSPRRNQS